MELVNAHYMFTHVHHMFTTCSWHFHHMFMTCSPHVHHMFIVHHHHMFIVHHMFTVHHMLTTCSPHVHDMLTTDFHLRSYGRVLLHGHLFDRRWPLEQFLERPKLVPESWPGHLKFRVLRPSKVHCQRLSPFFLGTWYNSITNIYSVNLQTYMFLWTSLKWNSLYLIFMLHQCVL